MSKRRKPKAPPSRDPDLRLAAEAQLARCRGTARESKAKPSREIVHELQVHQIELEMQNEELDRTHLALEESRDRYLDLYDFGPVGYFTFSGAGRIIEVNLTGAALLGVPRAKLIGRGLGSFVAPEDRDRWERHLAGVLHSAGPGRGPGEKQGCELKLQREDGSNLQALLESVRLKRSNSQESAGAGGEHPIICTAMSDISERSATEARLRLLSAAVESAGDGIAIADRQGTLLWVNSAFAELTGYGQDEAVGQNPRILKSGRQSPEFYQRMWQTILTGQVWRGELVNRRKNGALYSEEMTLTPVRMDGQEITHFIAIKKDISERKTIAETQEFLSRCGCPSSGESFFQALARYLAQSLGMDFVCIDLLAGDGLAAQTLAMYHDGKFEDNVAYALKDTPCGQVVGQTICCFPKDVRHLFPKDAVLQKLKAESYVGTTLWSFDGKPIGLIAVIGRNHLASPGFAESVLKLVAVRAAGELERMLAETALRESEARLKMAQQAGRIGTSERNLRTGEIIWSEHLEALYGLPASGFEGSYAAWQQRVLAADRPAVEAHLAQAVAQRGNFQFEYRVVWPDGTIHWLATAGKVVTDERGEPTRTLGVSMDITERKRAEEQVRGLNAELEQRVAARTAELRQTNDQLRREIEVRRLTEQELSEAELRYRTVADFTYDWEYWKTPEGLLLYCSPSCERVTGYTNSELAVSPKLLAQIIHPHDRDNWQRHEREAMAHPAPRSIVFRIQRKDKELRWIEHTCQPVIGSQGEFLGLRASNHDVTERKQAEMDMQQLRKELAHVTRVTTAGQLAASLAHELNQPLTAIRCNAETAETLLAAGPPNVAEAREALDDIARDSERAGGVIQGLRALFNKTSHEHSVVQINDIIYETLDLLRSEFALKGITAEVHLEPTLPELLGNHIELQQVVLNLVANAIDAMSECETGLHHLNIATVCEGSREIHVSVRDSGPGIQVQPISRLFEPFFTTKASGMGMGLAISQSILVAHGGSLGAVNNPDRGATFHFTLPVHQGEHL